MLPLSLLTYSVLYSANLSIVVEPLVNLKAADCLY
nr:MAG TPA: hypothetical protein [Caudoviricetes sp.]